LVIELHQITAALYLLAACAGVLGLMLPKTPFRRAALWLLATGALLHGISFARFHTLPNPPPLTDLSSAVSLAAWLAVLASLALLGRSRPAGLAVLVAPLAFLAVFYESLTVGATQPAAGAPAGSWPHLHVILASAGLALLGVAGLAGVLFLSEARALKAKRPSTWRRGMPSLEALDRVNAVALAIGFPLLSCGVVAGMLWTQSQTGHLWVGGAHAVWSVIAWAVYLVLMLARFAGGFRGRDAAAFAAFGFAFLLFVVIGVGAVT
jgi:ABC-type uncharacterized transport system permease subunit